MYISSTFWNKWNTYSSLALTYGQWVAWWKWKNILLPISFGDSLATDISIAIIVTNCGWFMKMRNSCKWNIFSFLAHRFRIEEWNDDRLCKSKIGRNDDFFFYSYFFLFFKCIGGFINKILCFTQLFQFSNEIKIWIE